MIRVRGVLYANEDVAHDEAVQREADERAERVASAQRAAEEINRRARTICQPCDCGGRGLCLDYA